MRNPRDERAAARFMHFIPLVMAAAPTLTPIDVRAEAGREGGQGVEEVVVLASIRIAWVSRWTMCRSAT